MLESQILQTNLEQWIRRTKENLNAQNWNHLSVEDWVHLWLFGLLATSYLQQKEMPEKRLH